MDSEAGNDPPTEEELIEETLMDQNPILVQEKYGEVEGRFARLWRSFARSVPK